MTTEAPAAPSRTQRSKDLLSLTLVAVAITAFAGGYGYSVTGNPLSVLTMPHNQSHAVSVINPPANHPEWAPGIQRMETGNDTIGGATIISKSWNTGTTEPTIHDLKEMLYKSGYEEATCYPRRSHCESTIQTTTGVIPVTISYHPMIEDNQPHHYEITAISIK